MDEIVWYTRGQVGTDGEPVLFAAAPGSEVARHLEESGATVVQGPDAHPAPGVAATGGVDYGIFTVADLRAELESRGLETTGVKAELVARLIADDEAAEAPPSQDGA